MKCAKSKKKVKWLIDKKFVNSIKYSLLKDKYEIAGSILFKDVNCKGDICDKLLLKDRHLLVFEHDRILLLY